MLKKFSVENFKGFKNKITFNIGLPNEYYNFYPGMSDKKCRNRGIIYGDNSSGKTNLGLAIFDITTHLTDNKKFLQNYDLYLNMNSEKPFAEFEYTFIFDKHELVYKYSKTDVDILVRESLSIDRKEVIYYDFLNQNGFILLEGANTLNASIKNKSPISRVKYVRNNSILADNEQNRVFRKFIDFVDRMLLLRLLDNDITDEVEGICNAGKIKDFQQFLKENHVEYDLRECEEIYGKKTIGCYFGSKNVSFLKIASTGTKSLTLFYYWYLNIKKASFVFIDEFDVFCHKKLENIEKKINEIQNAQIFVATCNYDLSYDFLLEDNSIRLMI